MMKKVLLSAMAITVALAFAMPVRAQEAAKPEKPKKHEYTGEITKIDASSITVKKKEEEKTFTVGAKVKVVVPGKEAGEMADLKVGDKVTVSYAEEDGKDVAHKITHADAKPKKPKKTEAPQ
jgi:Cu/Ag efflux protein CusF